MTSARDCAPFPLTHARLDQEEAALLAEIEALALVPRTSPDAPLAHAIRLLDASLLASLDQWRAELLAHDRAIANAAQWRAELRAEDRADRKRKKPPTR